MITAWQCEIWIKESEVKVWLVQGKCFVDYSKF